MRGLSTVIGWGICAVLVSGCVSAKIAVVDERTALENQILGSYEDLDRDLQLLASVRAVDPQGRSKEAPAFSEIRTRAIQARQTQQFNRDDVDELKRAGCLGEANTGMLAQRSCQATGDPQVAKRLERLLTSENQARQQVLHFVVTTSPDLTEKDYDQVVQAFAQMKRERAKSGEWVQDSAGKWKQAD